MQSWIAGGKASIMVQSSRMHLDPTCGTSLDTLKSPDCPVIGETVSPTGGSIRLSKPTPPTAKPVPVIGGAASAGEIGGITVGVVIIALLVVLIVILILVMMRKWKSTYSKRLAFTA